MVQGGTKNLHNFKISFILWIFTFWLNKFDSSWCKLVILSEFEELLDGNFHAKWQDSILVFVASVAATVYVVKIRNFDFDPKFGKLPSDFGVWYLGNLSAQGLGFQRHNKKILVKRLNLAPWCNVARRRRFLKGKRRSGGCGLTNCFFYNCRLLCMLQAW